MNVFGRLFRITIFGESHGPGVGIVIDGTPAGIPLQTKHFKKDLSRRKSGKRGTTERSESDIPELKSGIFKGKTTGSPLMIYIANRDIRPQDYSCLKHRPRPGHADLTSYYKSGGYNDYRGAGHLSGRLTAALVAGGVVAKKIIKPTQVKARILEIGGFLDIDNAIAKALKERDSVGGIIECRASPIPLGLGEPFFDSVESMISHLIFSIPGIKGIEFGSGFAAARMKGSEYNDLILDVKGKTATNHSGGINGGVTNGNPLIFRIAARPPATISKPQMTINLRTGKKEKLTIKGRHDACFALRLPVVVEAATSIVLADLMLQEQKIPRIWRKDATDRKNKKTD
ncbi:MAG: chorismate synthase [Candidatus Aminicenantales bacterium]